MDIIETSKKLASDWFKRKIKFDIGCNSQKEVPSEILERVTAECQEQADAANKELYDLLRGKIEEMQKIGYTRSFNAVVKDCKARVHRYCCIKNVKIDDKDYDAEIDLLERTVSMREYL